MPVPNGSLKFLVCMGLALATSGCTRAGAEASRRVGWLDGAGSRLRFRVSGTGPDTVVAVHGGFTLGAVPLHDALEALGPEYTIISYDQAGRGQSDPVDTTTIGLRADLDDLEAVRRHFGLGKMSLVGNHYGAAVAALYAHREPAHVERLVMVGPLMPRQTYVYELSRQLQDSAAAAALWAALAKDTALTRDDCARTWGFEFLPAAVTDRRVLARLAPSVCSASPPSIKRREAIRRSAMRSLGWWDWRDTAQAIVAPTLIVEGELDASSRASTPEARILAHATETWAAHLPQARLVRLDGNAWLPWLDAPASFLAALRPFLKDGEWPTAAVRIATPPATPTPRRVEPTRDNR